MVGGEIKDIGGVIIFSIIAKSYFMEEWIAKIVDESNIANTNQKILDTYI